MIHNSPDFDTVASSLAMNYILKQLGKEVLIISGDDELLDSTKNLLGSDDIVKMKFSEVDFESVDLYISIDTPVIGKISRDPIPTKPLPLRTIKIDHHTTEDPYGDINLIVNTSSAAEIMLHLFKAWKQSITPKLATCLFVGVSSDTGGFKFPLTTSSTYKAGAELIDLGADLVSSFFWVTAVRNLHLRALGRAMAKMEEYFNQKVQISTVTREDVDFLKTSFGELGPIHKLIGFYMSLSLDSAISVIIYERENGKTGISFRANNPTDLKDVSLLAKAMGGGGHKPAASCDFEGTIEEARSEVLKVMQSIYPDLGQP